LLKGKFLRANNLAEGKFGGEEGMEEEERREGRKDRLQPPVYLGP
jgi:hypothetical protein